MPSYCTNCSPVILILGNNQYLFGIHATYEFVGLTQLEPYIPGGLTASQFPVFTLYTQKVCLKKAPTCERAWTFEKVEGFAMDKYAKKRGRVSSRQNCEMLCLTETEFPCR